MQFNGAPVLFVPGNGGSYKQSRSFASVSLRKGIEENWSKHLDYFTGEKNQYTFQIMLKACTICVRSIQSKRDTQRSIFNS